MKPAAIAIMEAKFRLVFSQRRAIRLKRLSLPTACSIRARALQIVLAKRVGLFFSLALCGMTAMAPRSFAACRLACLAGIALVADLRARVDIGTQPEQGRQMRRVGFLAAGQLGGDWMPVKVGLDVDLGREPAARAAERLTRLPPFAPAAETWARTMVESNIAIRWVDDDSAAR